MSINKTELIKYFHKLPFESYIMFIHTLMSILGENVLNSHDNNLYDNMIYWFSFKGEIQRGMKYEKLYRQIQNTKKLNIYKSKTTN